MEIKNIKELNNSIELLIEGSINISKDTIKEWYNKYCKEPTPEPLPEPLPSIIGILSLPELIDKFNSILKTRGYNIIKETMSVYGYIKWACGFTDRCYNEDSWIFNPSSYPLAYDYRGSDNNDDGTAYNALLAWLIASILSELVPDSGEYTNTQTELFKLAYEIGGGSSYPLYNNKSFKSDPYSMREAASVMYAICRGDSNISSDIEKYRSELGGKAISASDWSGLGYENTTLTDAQGRYGYKMNYLGYCVNTTLFLPASPGPRITGTTVCNQPQPWNQGLDINLFNSSTGNYLMDEEINNYFVRNYNMMTQTPLSVWNSYPLEKQNRMVNVGAIPPCTFLYMFGKKNVKFDGIINKSYDGQIIADYYCFSPTQEDTGLVLDGPFSDLQGMYRFNGTGIREKWLSDVATIIDCFRFPTEDPNYGRCRPGCKPTRQGGELNPIHGSNENEIYNVDICTMVADDSESKEKYATQDGFAADSPRSYVSGHSALIWGLALILTQMNNEGNCENWIRKAYEYSVNRSIGRFHWTSDCIYGRMFGSLSLPIINAMTGLNPGYNSVKEYVLNPEQEPESTWYAHVILKNETSQEILSTGEIRLYIEGHEGINVYTPNAVSAGTVLAIQPGEEYEYDTICEGNGFALDDSYDGRLIEDARIYDERHWKNDDWTPPAKIMIDQSDGRGISTLNKFSGTYVLKIRNIYT